MKADIIAKATRDGYDTVVFVGESDGVDIYSVSCAADKGADVGTPVLLLDSKPPQYISGMDAVRLLIPFADDGE